MMVFLIFQYNTNTTIRDLSMLSVNDVCAVYHEETWYRAVIQAIVEDKVSLFVLSSAHFFLK